MTTTGLMDSVLGMDQKPAETDAETVTWRSTLTADMPLETARLVKPEVALKPVITRQPSVLVPFT